MPTSFSTLIARPRSKPYTATSMSLGSPTVGVMESGATCGPTKVSRAANKRRNAPCMQRLVEPSSIYRLLLSPRDVGRKKDAEMNRGSAGSRFRGCFSIEGELSGASLLGGHRLGRTAWADAFLR